VLAKVKALKNKTRPAKANRKRQMAGQRKRERGHERGESKIENREKSSGWLEFHTVGMAIVLCTDHVDVLALLLYLLSDIFALYRKWDFRI